MKKAYICAGISIACWSTVAVVSKLLLGQLDNIQLLWASAFFATLFLLVYNLIKGSLKKLKAYTFKDYAISILTGLPSTLFYYLFYYAGTDRMPASQAFIVNYLWPIMSVVFACMILKEKLTPRKIIAIVISFVGVVIVSGKDLLHLSENVLVGTLCCVLGAVSYGLFTALNRKYDYDKFVTLMLSYFASFLITTVINWVNGALFIPQWGQLLGFAWNGIFTMAIANTVWVVALSLGNTAKISNLAYITPFLSLVWTFLILKEPLNIYSIIGLVVIVCGILIQIRDKDKNSDKKLGV